MTMSAFEQLERGSRQEYDTLIELHDRFAVSSDPFMRYAAGWAAMYAAQRAVRFRWCTDTANAKEMALERWSEIDQPTETMYEADPDVIHANARLAIAMGDQICEEKRDWTESERLQIYRDISSIALDCLPVMADGNVVMTGELAEIACLQLMWRPGIAEDRPYVFNGIPAGPAKDRRGGTGSRYATDIYAYPALPGSRLKSVNVQVKSRLQKRDFHRYGYIMALIGANTHFAHPDKGGHTSVERIGYTVEACAMEAESPQASPDTPTLDISSSKVYSTIYERFLIRNPDLVDQDENEDAVTESAPPNPERQN